MVVYSLSTCPNRSKNLEYIVPLILDQCDVLYVNLVGYQYIPSILKSDKIIINSFSSAGSEIRFFNYNDKMISNDTYYFTIDDDILYPSNYTNVMVDNMIKHDNKCVCCVHGSNIDLSMSNNYYRKNRRVFHFTEKLDTSKIVMIPGVGTSCFYKGSVELNISNYTTKNMSDVFTSCFLSKKEIPVVCITRDSMWLSSLDGCGSSIYGNNPYDEIDKTINVYKSYLMKIDIYT